MKFDEIEERLVRSLRHLFDRKKILFMVPVVVTCGVVAWFCRALVLSASSWVSLSLTFLPLFFASAILFGAGVVLARVYHKEVRGERFSYRKIVRSTVPLLFQVGYFWVPVVLGYLVLWGLLGLFYLVKALPVLGNVLAMIFSFGPFLLLVGSLLMSLLCVPFLFYVTPLVAYRSLVDVEAISEVVKRVKRYPLAHGIFLLVALIPTSVVVALLLLAVYQTTVSYSLAAHSWSMIGQFFFIMIPFSVLLAPVAIFFFQFACEGYMWVQTKECESQ